MKLHIKCDWSIQNYALINSYSTILLGKILFLYVVMFNSHWMAFSSLFGLKGAGLGGFNAALIEWFDLHSLAKKFRTTKDITNQLVHI